MFERKYIIPEQKRIQSKMLFLKFSAVAKTDGPEFDDGHSSWTRWTNKKDWTEKKAKSTRMKNTQDEKTSNLSPPDIFLVSKD